MISLILAEAAVERVPRELLSHPSVLRHARRVGRDTHDLLLDRSYHHDAMKGLKNAEKRGRPDLVHFALLSATATPLYSRDEMTVYLHTRENLVITIGKRVRLPKTYARFETLILQLLSTRVIESDGQVLLSLRKLRFQELSSSIGSDITVCLSSRGSMNTVESIAEEVRETRNATFVIGGFPNGDFSRDVLDHVDSLYSISSNQLEAHLVVARLVYELERRKDR